MAAIVFKYKVIMKRMIEKLHTGEMYAAECILMSFTPYMILAGLVHGKGGGRADYYLGFRKTTQKYFNLNRKE